MKFLHTSDLHIGLRLCEQSMNDEIKYILDEIVRIAEEEKCSAVVIAGDIYDRANPAPDSVKIFDSFVSALVMRKIAVIGISGNHDSPERIGCFSDVLCEAGVYFSPAFDGSTKVATLYDEYGDVNFILMPFVKPSVCAVYSGKDISDYTEAMRYQIELANVDKSKRNVIVAHGFTGDRAFDEEAGGTGYISPEVFELAEYTALGHLHTAHSAGGDNIRYSGSPYRCSYAEKEDKKQVNIVTLGEKGVVNVETRELHPLHDLVELRGSYDELTSLETRSKVKDGDYIKAVLTDEEDIEDAVMKLRIIYPSLMQLSYDNSRTAAEFSFDEESMASINDSLRPEDVFAELYELQNGVSPDSEIMECVKALFYTEDTN